MSESTDEANPGYALGEWSKALQAAAWEKADSWRGVFQGMLSGLLHIGSRTPIRDTPVWATPEVMKGGFASGRLLAERPFDTAESQLAEVLQVEPRRGPLQRGLLSEAGLSVLLDRLQGRDYELETPEEAALLVAAWLASHNQLTEAAALIQELEPWMERLRFFPIRRSQSAGTGCLLQDLELTRNNLRCLRPQRQYVAMRQAIRQRKPLLDRLVALWMETRADGWPAQQYPADWAERGHQLLKDWRRLNKNRWAEKGQHAILRDCLAVALLDPGQLTGRQVGKLRRILVDIERARGLPGSERHRRLREAQLAETQPAGPWELAAVMLDRLPLNGGLDEVESWLLPVNNVESLRHQVPEGQTMPFERILRRSWRTSMANLVRTQTANSPEVLARLLPMSTSQVEAEAYRDGDLAHLMGTLYESFRRRRSLLLLQLSSQVRLSDLPWVKVLAPWRQHTADSQSRARDLLHQAVSLWLQGWPQVIAPNPLLREIGSLARAVDLQLPLVEELAVDIFQGEFGEKFLRSAQCAARLLHDSPYQRYYRLPVERLLALDDVAPARFKTPVSPGFAALCVERAGHSGGNRQAYHGRIIEQQQIFTTHNLAVLTEALDLRFEVTHPLQCLSWLCRVWPMANSIAPADSRSVRQARLRAQKNCAYGWRQLVFFVSRLGHDQQHQALEQGLALLEKAPHDFLKRQWEELGRAVAGKPLQSPPWLAWKSV